MKGFLVLMSLSVLLASLTAFADQKVDYTKLYEPKVAVSDDNAMMKACNSAREACTATGPYHACLFTCIFVGKDVDLRHRYFYYNAAEDRDVFNQREIFYNQEDYMKDKVCIGSSFETEPFGKVTCDTPADGSSDAVMQMLSTEAGE